MRASLLALCAVALITGTAAAEPCGAVDDPNQLDAWADASDLGPAPADLDGTWPPARRALIRFIKQLRTPSDPALAESSARLVETARSVLGGYDGTFEKAHLLAVDDVTPTACGEREIDGIPERLCAWFVLRDPPLEVPFDGPLSCAQKRQLGGHVKQLHAIVSSVHSPHIEDALEALERHDEAWEQLITRGHSQYPWEVWVHGTLLPPDAWGPSRHQLIVAHPSAGFGVQHLSGAHGQDPAAAAVVALEALGYLYYFREFRQHVGLSVAASVGNLAFQRVSLGPVVHVTGIGLGYGYDVTQGHAHTLFLLIDVSSALDDGMLEKLARRATVH